MCHKKACVEVTTGFPSLCSSASRKSGWHARKPLQPMTTTLAAKVEGLGDGHVPKIVHPKPNKVTKNLGQKRP
jgi:hypothetical protein